jgi:hypothetical protein
MNGPNLASQHTIRVLLGIVVLISSAFASSIARAENLQHQVGIPASASCPSPSRPADTHRRVPTI